MNDELLLEIESQKHKMFAEGTKDTKPTHVEIAGAINKRGFLVYNLEVFHDDMMGFWRFIGKIKKLTPNQGE